MSLGRFLLGAIIGGIAGAAVGLLLAPQSGRETRQTIREELDKRKEEMSRRYSEKAEDFRHSAETLKAKASDISSRVKKLSEDLEDTGRKTLDNVKDRLRSEFKKTGHPEVDEMMPVMD